MFVVIRGGTLTNNGEERDYNNYGEVSKVVLRPLESNANQATSKVRNLYYDIDSNIMKEIDFEILGKECLWTHDLSYYYESKKLVKEFFTFPGGIKSKEYVYNNENILERVLEKDNDKLACKYELLYFKFKKKTNTISALAPNWSPVSLR